MLDVHMPQATHTWKDFWIHLGTIAAGLLIAISLEQSVEALHRLHLRHELEASLREEAARNHDNAEVDVVIYNNIVKWLLQLQSGVDAARTADHKVPFVYPARPDGLTDSLRVAAYHILSTEAWTTAKESSLLVLLPRDEAAIYARVYLQSERVEDAHLRSREYNMRQTAFESRFAKGAYPPALDISRLTPQQLDEYEAFLTDALEAARVTNTRLKIFIAANDYVLSGGKSEQSLRDAQLKGTTK